MTARDPVSLYSLYLFNTLSCRLYSSSSSSSSCSSKRLLIEELQALEPGSGGNVVMQLSEAAEKDMEAAFTVRGHVRYD